MAEGYIGQIMFCGFNFPPRGYALCNGQLLPASQNQALFGLIGRTYGGDGKTTFALPNLRGSTPIGFGASAAPDWKPAPYPLGSAGGFERVRLSPDEIPIHSHLPQGTEAAGGQANPAGTLFASNSASIYAPAGAAQVTLSEETIALAGGGQPHNNMQPFLAISFCIALTGQFPPPEIDA